MNRDLKIFTDILIQKYGKDVLPFDSSYLSKSLERRLSITGCDSYNTYIEFLEANNSEAKVFFDSLNNTFTEFFRNPLTFSVLERNILPSLIQKKKDGKEKEIRIWSSACASGQETYSIAMLMDEVLEHTKAKMTCRIFATDINQDVLKQAKKGVYQTESMNNITLKRADSHFTKQAERYIISSQLKETIDYSHFDLLSEKESSPPASIYGDFDLVFCSNVLFYYAPEYQKRILEKIEKSLTSGAYVITGETERNIVKKNGFREVFVNSSIFQKK